ncbi:MAG TPA: dienelactone hydrolase family protein [Vicinamibacteria bacterium]|nr:dienelactone hydrolase family protein [Vicinamibacteria bacterium]
MIVRSEYRDLVTPTGPMRTHVYTPAHPTVTKKYPGLLVYPEIFQQTSPIARLCVQLASHGYVVMAPEIYHEHEAPGTVLAYDDVGKDKGNRYKHATKLSTFDNDAKAVETALRAHPACSGRLGTVGFCIGGHLAVRAALQPDILACASFFPTDLHTGTLGEGKNADTLARIRETKAELVMIWGRQDPHIPAEGRATVYKALTEAGLLFSWHEFNAEHAFMRDEGARYDAEVARTAMGLALTLFGRTL